MSIRGKLIGAFLLSLFLMFGLAAINEYNSNRLLESRKWVEHTQTVLERAESLISFLKDEETGERGFALTGDVTFLEPYDLSRSKLPPVLAELKALTVDNPTEQHRLTQIEDLMASRLALSARDVDAHKTAGAKPEETLSLSRQGKKFMDRIREIVADVETEERTLLRRRVEASDATSAQMTWFSLAGTLAAALLIGITGTNLILYFNRCMRRMQESLSQIASGELAHRIKVTASDEFGKLSDKFNEMAVKLQHSTEESASQTWLNSNLARFAQLMQEPKTVKECAELLLRELASTVGALHGLFYVVSASGGTKYLNLLATYAYQDRKLLSNRFEFGESLVGQCALEQKRIRVSSAPKDYVYIRSGIGQSEPVNLVVVPIVFENQIHGVIELASFKEFTSVELSFLDHLGINLGVIFSNIEAAEQTTHLLQQEQMLTEELKSQQEELTATNTQLEHLANSLQSSEEELRQQQEELQQMNEELEERSTQQTKQNAELEAKNLELESLRQDMQAKAHQLSITSKYKSEFLANMSHELRTPLNSLLILSKVLSDNSENNLTPKQVEFANTINAAGSDLLLLIDDVLDISKIEAGAMAIECADEPIRDMCHSLMAGFKAMANEKNISLLLEIHSQLPRLIYTDSRRLQQILRNLISNAIKFTVEGSVTIEVEPATSGWAAASTHLSKTDLAIAFRVIDTGVGIDEPSQSVIFEAFQQADGSINRKYGGTGLGLAISRQLVHLLGGEITVESTLGSGSCFTVYIPVQLKDAPAPAPASVPTKLPVQEPLNDADYSKGNSEKRSHVALTTGVADDRDGVQEGDKVLLLVDSDPVFVQQLTDLAHSHRFKVVTASQGKTALQLARRYKPDAIIIDLGLPDKDGWTLLDRLKRDSSTRHIPVQIFSADDRFEQARRLGIIGYLPKPATRDSLNDAIDHLAKYAERQGRHLLIVEDDELERKNLCELIAGPDVTITAVGSGTAALAALSEQKFDCMVLDLGLPDMSGMDVLTRAKAEGLLKDLSVIVYTNRSLSSQQETELRRNAETVIIKSPKSASRLLDETTLFLHRVETNMPEPKRKILERLHLKDSILTARTVLVVDDDIRHIFAITSMLEQYEMNVLYAQSGKEALALLEKSAVDLVLMDVMMPEMDGVECMKVLRQQTKFKSLPVIALTAKAMKGDREQCIAAGASDYLCKPVDSDQLLSLMRVWLY